jgi:hypothetical protein
MEAATPCFRLSSATRRWPVLAVGRHSNASRVTPIRGLLASAQLATAGPPARLAVCLRVESYSSSGRTAPRVRLQVRRVRCWLLWRIGTMPRMRRQIARAISCLRRPNPYDPGAVVLPLLEWYIRSAETSATSVLGRMGHGDTVMRVSCSFVGLSIACHGAVSRHGELRATRMLRDSGLYVAARCPSCRVLV